MAGGGRRLVVREPLGSAATPNCRRLCILVEMVCGHRVSEKTSNYLKTTHRPSLLGTPVHNYGPSFMRLKRRAAPRRVGPASAK